MRLERVLSDWFGSSTKRPPIPDPADPTPISIRPTVKVQTAGDWLRLFASVSVSLKSGSELKSVRVRIDLACLVREEDGVSSSDPIPLQVTHGADVTREDDHWVATISQNIPIELTVESDLYDPAWTVRFVPEVRPISEEVEA